MKESRLVIIPKNNDCQEAILWLRAMNIDFEEIDQTKRFLDIGSYGVPLLATPDGFYAGIIAIKKYAFEKYQKSIQGR